MSIIPTLNNLMLLTLLISVPSFRHALKISLGDMLYLHVNIEHNKLFVA